MEHVEKIVRKNIFRDANVPRLASCNACSGGISSLFANGKKGTHRSYTLFIYIATTLLLVMMTATARAQYNTDRVLTAGRSALYYEDYVLSIQYFNSIITLKPFLYEPWFYRGLAKYCLGDYTGAESDCTEAMKLNPYVVGIYELRGICRVRQDNYKGAIADYDMAIKYAPTEQGFWYNRVLCRMEDGDYDTANADLDSMLTRWKVYAKAWQLKAEVSLRQQDTLSAAGYLDKALEQDPYDASLWSMMAMVSLSRKKWKDADEQLSKAIHYKPTVANNYVNRALARYNINNLRGAMADYDKAIDLEPNNFLAHYNRGQLRMQVGDYNRAIEDFDFVLNLEPNNMLALFNRALLYDKTGDLYLAIRAYTRVINEFPNFWTGLHYRADCYRRLGMTAKAEADEFRVIKAQMDKSLGIQPRWSKSKTKEVRKQSDIDPEKYSQLVEADDQKMDHEYSSAYRGKIQNRRVEDALMPMYALNYMRYNNGVKGYTAFVADVEKLNTAATEAPIYVTCNPGTLNESDANAYFSLIGTLTARITNSENLVNDRILLLRRAIAYFVTQNLEDAIGDLTALIETDSLEALAYWQRAVCQYRLSEFDAAGGLDTQLKMARVIDDLTRASVLTPNNPYLYYDRGNVYAMRKNYGSAIDDYSKAIEMEPNLAEAYYNRGLIHLRKGDKESGIADLSKAGELGLYDAYSIIKKYSTSK